MRERKQGKHDTTAEINEDKTICDDTTSEVIERKFVEISVNTPQILPGKDKGVRQQDANDQ